MEFAQLNDRGLLLLGCGKMGSAMLEGWLKGGLSASAVHVLDPKPSDWLQALVRDGLHLNGPVPTAPAIAVVAVKPQMMGEALPAVTALGNGDTVILSIAAGTPIAAFEAAFGDRTPVIRSMPNTPAAIGQGITALAGNAHVTDAQMAMAEGLLAAIGQTVRLEGEGQIDAVTGVSGSGPAYVFHLIETLAAAGEAEGLPAEMAMKLAKATVAGAGQLALGAAEAPDQLRRNVTSPNGTTQAGLEVLMDEKQGLGPLIRATVRAATARSVELGKGG